MSSELDRVNHGDLAVPMPGILGKVLSADNADFIPSLRIKNPTSQKLQGDAGEWVLGNDLILGENVKFQIGPWRMAARRFEGETLGLQSYNRTESAKFFKNDSGLWEWQYPDNSDAFLEIFEKRKADAGMKVRNLVGFDFLIWLPDFNKWGLFFLAGKQKALSSCFADFVRNPNRIFVMNSKRGPGQYHYYIPTSRLMVLEGDKELSWPEDAEEVFTKFIETPIEVCSDSLSDSPSVER